MQNNNEFVDQPDQSGSSFNEAQRIADSNENYTIGGTTSRRERKGRSVLGNFVRSFQGARRALTGNGAKAAQASFPQAPLEEPLIPLPSDEMERGASRLDELTIDVAKWARRLLIPLAIIAWSGVGILLLWVAGHVSKTILLLIIAALLAYALAPLVSFLQRFMPRFLAIIIVYLFVLSGIGGLLYMVVRSAIDQVSSLATHLGALLTSNNGHPSPLEQTLNSLGITADQINSARNGIISSAQGLVGNVGPLLAGFADSALDVILVTVLSIYLLIDGSRFTRWFRYNMPRRQRGRTRFLLETLQRVVGGYIRGQLLMCTLIGILVGVGMWAFRVPYALLLGVLAFVLEFIPVLGTLVSGAICVLLALTQGWIWALVVLVYFVIVHIIEGDVVGPRIVGRAVGLHPIVSLIALIAGGELFGIWGALLASPIAGILQAFLKAIWSEWREMHPQDFDQARNVVADKIEKHVADRPLDGEPEAKLLRDSE